MYPDALRGREVEVLRLIAAAKSNREIGDELFIAVARHVSHIFSKTGSPNRAGAAKYANQKRLL